MIFALYACVTQIYAPVLKISRVATFFFHLIP